jgi:hypothetical protein
MSKHLKTRCWPGVVLAEVRVRTAQPAMTDNYACAVASSKRFGIVEVPLVESDHSCGGECARTARACALEHRWHAWASILGLPVSLGAKLGPVQVHWKPDRVRAIEHPGNFNALRVSYPYPSYRMYSVLLRLTCCTVRPVTHLISGWVRDLDVFHDFHRFQVELEVTLFLHARRIQPRISK